jgi:hypothetical protein|tara:strand:+ start:1643 stop:1897 length:255 start_codon:yes stop_codon:yes gene_type:complete
MQENFALPQSMMILETTAYGYVSTNFGHEIESVQQPVRIYKMGNPENRTWMPEIIGVPVSEEFVTLAEAVEFAESHSTRYGSKF